MLASASSCVNDTLKTSVSLPRFRFADANERTAFGPAQHIRAVHPANQRGTRLRRGFVIWGQGVRWRDGAGREYNWKQWSSRLVNAEVEAESLIASGHQGTVNQLYFSMQSFRKPNSRKTWNLAALGCCFVDLDYKARSRWNGKDPLVVLRAALAALDDASIPPPSFAMDSGNGIHAVWLHDLLPPTAIRRWNLVQERLVQALQSFGADPAAKDASRVLRLAGSWNPKAKNGRGHVHLIWIQGAELAKPYRYEFDSMADEILPMRRAEIRSLRAERAKRRATSKTGRKSAVRRDSASYAETILEDLERLRMHRYSSAFGRLPVGQRDTWLFVASMALSWVTPAAALEGQIVALACEVSGWSEREARSRMGSIIRRAKDAAAGKSVEFEGRELDPRYRMKAETIVRWLSISNEEMQAAGLRVLLDASSRRIRNVEACRARRLKNGATSHETKRAERIKLGKRALWLVRDGLTRKQVATEIGVSEGLIGKAIEEVRRTMTSTSQNASNTEAITIRHVYGGYSPPKGGMPVPGGTGCSHPARQNQKRHIDPSDGGTALRQPKTLAALGSETDLRPPTAAKQPPTGQQMDVKQNLSCSSSRTDRGDGRRVLDASTTESTWMPPRFLRRTG
ncbi:hypothetical protein BJ123_13023 [Rhodopseudomonas thermotolerans]|uniref:Replication protein n=2 Tax=Rhodopseudomonas TaxID=1073 RepID=A0A336JUB5_9BRAD|nr:MULTISPECIES: hypothetical protein [Rhodopseudomonas]RED25790.1 hypothetical protein BJ125_13023 [Rhodopseudomonas pentothenatexigens]REF90419.1 hypothetical protein BJ123_13023 [Rhodopseudomonas thermotolerans]SSW93118.1 hypothetical protein SAMN05892882_13023 [Rhodopseudomonas pentothenatexigens]